MAWDDMTTLFMEQNIGAPPETVVLVPAAGGASSTPQAIISRQRMDPQQLRDGRFVQSHDTVALKIASGALRGDKVTYDGYDWFLRTEMSRANGMILFSAERTDVDEKVMESARLRRV